MSSPIFTLTGNTPILSLGVGYPPIDSSNGDYEVGLIIFVTFNSISNIDYSNNRLYFHMPRIYIVGIPSERFLEKNYENL